MTIVAAPTLSDRLAAGSMAGMVAIAVCHPFDTLRTRMQSSSKLTSISQALNNMVKRESIFALYNGFWPPFFSQGLYKAIVFTVSSFIGDHLHQIPYLAPYTTTISIISGASAGTVNSFIVTPIELVRNRMQLQGSGLSSVKYRSSIDCAMHVVRSDGGWRSLWRGNTATIARDSVGMAAYFTAYDVAKRALAPHLSETATTLVAGACGGLGFWVLALPLDTAKTLIQIDSPIVKNTNTAGGRKISLLWACQQICKQYGIKYFFRGWQVAFSRGIPSAAITFYVYNKAMAHMVSIKEKTH